METLTGKVSSQPYQTDGSLTFLLICDGWRPVSVLAGPGFTKNTPKRGDTVELTGDWPAEMNEVARHHPFFIFRDLKHVSNGNG